MSGETGGRAKQKINRSTDTIDELVDLQASKVCRTFTIGYALARQIAYLAWGFAR